MTKAKSLHRKWMKEPEYRKAHAALTPEFELAHAVIEARTHAGLTQEQLATRMKTSKSAIARLESDRGRPSTRVLERLAAATGTRLKISFESSEAQPEAALSEASFCCGIQKPRRGNVQAGARVATNFEQRHRQEE